MATSSKKVNDTLAFPLVTDQHYNLQSEVQPYHPVQPKNSFTKAPNYEKDEKNRL